MRHSHGIRKLKATLDKNQRGFGFLIFENRTVEDLFLPPRNAQSLFHGDRVEVTLNSQDEIIDLRVLEHRFRELVGRFSPHPTRGGWVLYERRKAREEVYLPDAPHGLKPGDWVRAKLEFHHTGPFPVTATITETYGQALPASADIGMVAAEYNLIEEHSAAAVAEAQSFRLDTSADGAHRVDLKHIPFITIDGETARDFDDAIYVERKKAGHTLWVAIADVSHYVRHGTALDKEARSRGTSVYFPERAFHMLPRALSENLCSLRPNEPRLALVAKMEFNHAGHRTGVELIEGIIESRRRATYTEIQQEWEANQANTQWAYAPHFELYQTLRRIRRNRGSIDFDLPEAEIRVDANGEVLSITNRPRFDAHRLIEEFMIAANESVTDWSRERSWPFIYRIHDEPSAESLQRFQKLAATVGVRFSLEQGSSPKVMAEIIRRLEGHPAQALLNMAFLRSMKQAVYSAEHGGHYGLASGGYTHFTSPIRRYPDLVVHRLLRQALRARGPHRGESQKTAPPQKLQEELEDIAEHCSYRERIAADAERESIKLKQVRAMRARLGEEFDARVVGLHQSGLFVQIGNPYCEGLVPKETITDDFYEFNEERMILYGVRKRRTFKVGDAVRVRAVSADLDRRQIDFALLASEKPHKEVGAPAQGSAEVAGRRGRRTRQKQPR